MRTTVLLLALLASACGGESFFLERRGAVMPVWVRGSTTSDAVLLMVAGGPGDTSLLNHAGPAWQTLESRFTVVYWDQRGAGSSLGNPEPGSFTVADAVADLDLAVQAVLRRLPGRRLFLLSHSWGGYVATAYLVDPAHQARVAGSIVMDGTHDLRRQVTLSQAFVAQRAQLALDRGEDPTTWTEALTWARAGLPEQFDLAFVSQVGRYVGMAGGAGPNASPPVDLGAALFSPFNAMAYDANQARVREAWDFNVPSLTPQLDEIRVPSLLTWGRHDGIVPVQLGHEALEGIGAARKELVVFEQSGHTPADDEPAAWADSVSRFVEETR